MKCHYPNISGMAGWALLICVVWGCVTAWIVLGSVWVVLGCVTACVVVGSLSALKHCKSHGDDMKQYRLKQYYLKNVVLSMRWSETILYEFE